MSALQRVPIEQKLDASLVTVANIRHGPRETKSVPGYGVERSLLDEERSQIFGVAYSQAERANHRAVSPCSRSGNDSRVADGHRSRQPFPETNHRMAPGIQELAAGKGIYDNERQCATPGSTNPCTCLRCL